MKKMCAAIMIVIISAFALFNIKTANAAIGDIWCIGGSTYGWCINSTGNLVPQAASTLSIGSVSYPVATVNTVSLASSGTMSLTGPLVTAGSMSATPSTTYSSVNISTSFSPVGQNFMVINGSGTPNITLTSTPHIAISNAVSGQILTITGGANTVTFTDNGTLAGSLVELADTTRTVGTGDMLVLRYYSGKWYEVSFSNN